VAVLVGPTPAPVVEGKRAKQVAKAAVYSAPVKPVVSGQTAAQVKAAERPAPSKPDTTGIGGKGGVGGVAVSAASAPAPETDDPRATSAPPGAIPFPPGYDQRNAGFGLPSASAVADVIGRLTSQDPERFADDPGARVPVGWWTLEVGGTLPPQAPPWAVEAEGSVAEWVQNAAAIVSGPYLRYAARQWARTGRLPGGMGPAPLAWRDGTFDWTGPRLFDRIKLSFRPTTFQPAPGDSRNADNDPRTLSIARFKARTRGDSTLPGFKATTCAIQPAGTPFALDLLDRPEQTAESVRGSSIAWVAELDDLVQYIVSRVWRFRRVEAGVAAGVEALGEEWREAVAIVRAAWENLVSLAEADGQLVAPLAELGPRDMLQLFLREIREVSLVQDPRDAVVDALDQLEVRSPPMSESDVWALTQRIARALGQVTPTVVQPGTLAGFGLLQELTVSGLLEYPTQTWRSALQGAMQSLAPPSPFEAGRPMPPVMPTTVWALVRERGLDQLVRTLEAAADRRRWLTVALTAIELLLLPAGGLARGVEWLPIPGAVRRSLVPANPLALTQRASFVVSVVRQVAAIVNAPVVDADGMPAIQARIVRVASLALALLNELGIVRDATRGRGVPHLFALLTTLERVWSPAEQLSPVRTSAAGLAALAGAPRPSPMVVLPRAQVANLALAPANTRNVPPVVITAVGADRRRIAEEWIRWWAEAGPIRRLASTLEGAGGVADGLVRMDDRWWQALGIVLRDPATHTRAGAAVAGEIARLDVPQAVRDIITNGLAPDASVTLAVRAPYYLARIEPSRILPGILRQVWTDIALQVLVEVHGLRYDTVASWFWWMETPVERDPGGRDALMDLDPIASHGSDVPRLVDALLGPALPRRAPELASFLGLGDEWVNLRPIATFGPLATRLTEEPEGPPDPARQRGYLTELLRMVAAAEPVSASGWPPFALAPPAVDLDRRIGAIGAGVDAFVNPAGLGVVRPWWRLQSLRLAIPWLGHISGAGDWRATFDRTVGAAGVRRVG
jgi:hypothetical protein